MAHKRRLLHDRRPAAEYLLMAIMLVLFMFGVWAWRAGNEPAPAGSKSEQYEPGSIEQLDALMEQDVEYEVSADSQNDTDLISDSALDGAADSIGGSYDETDY